MIVGRQGESSPVGLMNDKEYAIISIEKGRYRIVDESGESYICPSEFFEIEEGNDGAVFILDRSPLKYGVLARLPEMRLNAWRPV